MFGVTLAKIHSIDLQATGLDQHLQHLSPEDYVRQTWNAIKTLQRRSR